jgi:hypothetical protein
VGVCKKENGKFINYGMIKNSQWAIQSYTLNTIITSVPAIVYDPVEVNGSIVKLQCIDPSELQEFTFEKIQDSTAIFTFRSQLACPDNCTVVSKHKHSESSLSAGSVILIMLVFKFRSMANYKNS